MDFGADPARPRRYLLAWRLEGMGDLRMVATTVDLPNIRRFFIPDPGMSIVEIDLQRAESQIVAWESGDTELKHIFQTGIDIHTTNARDWLFGDPVSYWRRDKAKRSIYAIQNGGKVKRIAELCGIDESKAARFYNWWTTQHPLILRWHERLLLERLTTSCIRNVWGYKKHYYDRKDISETERNNMIREMVPWITQSTIAICIGTILLNLEELPEVQMLLQVHDSLVMQVPTSRLAELVPEIRRLSRVEIPYSDPLVIPVTLQASDVSWGHIEEIAA